MENTKLIATVASIWIQCSCGASFAFGIYSAVLKSSQGYDQSTIDTVSVFKDIGSNIGILSGLLYHAVMVNHTGSPRSWSARFGSGLSVVYLAGAVQCFTSYFLMWLSVIGVIERPPVLVMCIFMFIGVDSNSIVTRLPLLWLMLLLTSVDLGLGFRSICREDEKDLQVDLGLGFRSICRELLGRERNEGGG